VKKIHNFHREKIGKENIPFSLIIVAQGTVWGMGGLKKVKSKILPKIEPRKQVFFSS
jgi:hypothetical protein